jgi:hypothetical protein
VNNLQTILIIFLAIILTFLSTFFYVKRLGQKEYEAKYNEVVSNNLLRIKELELSLEKEQQNIKIKVVTEYVDKISVVKEKEYIYVDRVKEVVPDDIMLPVGWVQLHDAAATGIDSYRSTETVDGRTEGIRASDAIERVIHNYSICEQNRQQLISLQKWINDTIESAEKN